MPSVTIKPRDEDAAYEDWRAREDWEELEREQLNPISLLTPRTSHGILQDDSIRESSPAAPEKGGQSEIGVES